MDPKEFTEKEILCLEDAENGLLRRDEDHMRRGSIQDIYFHFCYRDQGNKSSSNIITRCFKKDYLKIGKKLNTADWGLLPSYKLVINTSIVKVIRDGDKYDFKLK